MAIRLIDRYPNRVDPATSSYPHGEMRNRSAPGENDGTPLEQDWGNDFNAFFQSLVEAADITPSGTVDTVPDSQYMESLVQVANGVTEVDVAGDSDVDLNTDQARIAMVKLTGELTGDVDVVFPDTERGYVVINNTSGDFQINCRTSAGSGLTVPQDGTRWVRCDGADLVAVLNDVSSTVDSVEDLRASSFPANLERLWLSGYYGAGTAGGGPLYRSSGTDDGGVKFEAGDGSIWERNYSGDITLEMFGVVPNDDTAAADNAAALIDADAAAEPFGAISVSPGKWHFDTTGVADINLRASFYGSRRPIFVVEGNGFHLNNENRVFKGINVYSKAYDDLGPDNITESDVIAGSYGLRLGGYCYAGNLNCFGFEKGLWISDRQQNSAEDVRIFYNSYNIVFGDGDDYCNNNEAVRCQTQFSFRKGVWAERGTNYLRGGNSENHKSGAEPSEDGKDSSIHVGEDATLITDGAYLESGRIINDGVLYLDKVESGSPGNSRIADNGFIPTLNYMNYGITRNLAEPDQGSGFDVAAGDGTSNGDSSFLDGGNRYIKNVVQASDGRADFTVQTNDNTTSFRGTRLGNQVGVRFWIKIKPIDPLDNVQLVINLEDADGNTRSIALNRGNFWQDNKTGEWQGFGSVQEINSYTLGDLVSISAEIWVGNESTDYSVDEREFWVSTDVVVQLIDVGFGTPANPMV